MGSLPQLQWCRTQPQRRRPRQAQPRPVSAALPARGYRPVLQASANSGRMRAQASALPGLPESRAQCRPTRLPQGPAVHAGEQQCQHEHENGAVGGHGGWAGEFQDSGVGAGWVGAVWCLQAGVCDC